MSSLQQAFDLDKPLYTISIASEILQTHPRTLMLYEEVGLISPFRTATNRRRYSQRDLRKLQVIQFLTRELGVNLAGVRCILDLFAAMVKGGQGLPQNLREAYDRFAQIEDQEASSEGTDDDAEESERSGDREETPASRSSS
jgi:MerR family transcriptional regulator, heat shock protein HspR